MVVLTTDHSKLDDDEDLQDDVPEWLDPQPLVVASDERWEGRQGTLDTPIIVRTGATLELVDCNLSVHLLELLLGNQSWITVEEGGRLVLERTDLGIYYEPQLEDAVVAIGYPSQGTPCSISRVVNLEGAEDPVLSLDLFWWRGNTTVFVGVQDDVGEDLDLVSRIEPDNSSHRAWTNWNVSLADHGDRIVRLIVFTNESGYKDVIIGQVRVMDGSGELPSDRFGSGRAWEDGWLCKRFGPILMPSSWRTPRAELLVHSLGDVTISGSRVHASPGLPRWDVGYAASRYHDEPAEYIHLTVRRNDETATGGAHIQVVGARLTIDSSTILFTPIIVQNSEVSITESELRGDADLLAINASHGSIRDCDLTSLPFQQIQRAQYSDRTGRLEKGVAVSFNHTDGPLSIRNSLFTGSRVGLDLNHAWVQLEGCEFEGYTELAIRDHDSTGLGTYPDITSRNTIHPSSGNRYFRTHTATFELTGPGKPAPGRRYSYNTGLVSWEGMEGYDRQDIVFVDSYQLHLLMPTLLVDSSGGEAHIEEVSLDIFTEWGGALEVELDTDLRGGTIELDPTLEDGYVYSYGRNRVSREEAYGGAPGLVNVSLDIQVRDEFKDSWLIVLRLDGETLGMVGVDEADPPFYSNHDGYVNFTLDVSSGLHRLNYALIAQSIIDWQVEELWNETVPYLRADAGVDRGELGAFVHVGNGTLLLDPGVHLIVDRFSPEDAKERQSINLVLSNGSRFDLGGATLPLGTRLYINASGNGTVGLSDIETGSLYLRCNGADVEVEDVDCEGLLVRSYGGDMSLRHLKVTNRTNLYVHDAEGFRIWDSTIEVRTARWSTVLYAYESNITVDNVIFRGDGDKEFPFVLLDNSTLAMTSSSFDGIIGSVHSGYGSESDVAFYVSGCEFNGSGAGLWISGYYYDPTMFIEGSAAEGNRFSGEGCSLVCQFYLVDRVLGPNELVDGARFYAMYNLNVMLSDPPEEYRHIRREFLLDEDQVALAEDLLKDEWESWLSIFVEGALPDMIVVDPEPVTLMLRTEYSLPNDASAWWVLGFANVDPTSPLNEVPVLFWEEMNAYLMEFLGTLRVDDSDD